MVIRDFEFSLSRSSPFCESASNPVKINNTLFAHVLLVGHNAHLTSSSLLGSPFPRWGNKSSESSDISKGIELFSATFAIVWFQCP